MTSDLESCDLFSWSSEHMSGTILNQLQLSDRFFFERPLKQHYNSQAK